MLLPDEQTCKGADELNPDNSKHMVGRKGLGPKWMNNRNCHCGVYRVCTNYTCIVNDTYTFTGYIETETPLDVEIFDMIDCLPIMPFNVSAPYPESVLISLPPEKRPVSNQLMCAGGDGASATPTPPPSLNFTEVPSDVPTQSQTPNLLVAIIALPPTIVLNVTSLVMDETTSSSCELVGSVFANGVYRYMYECTTTTPVTGCIEQTLPTNYSTDIDRTSCSHLGEKINDNDNITGWQVAVILLSVFGVLLLILCLVSYPRTGKYTKLSEKDSGEVQIDFVG
jgi:hypothetical protein